MANRDFKIELDNVEMINGSDDLLKDTKITKVTLTGENKLNSLNSTFENCTELTVIEGDVNLDGVSDMTEMTLNTTLDELKVTNPTEENIQTDNSLNQVTNVKIGGTKYAKGGVQDVVGSLEWTAENFTYEDAILDNVYTNSSSIEESKNITVSDTLEQKATSIEITGQTYENLVNGKATKNLLDEMSMQQTEGSPTQFTPHMEQPICLEYIEGQTYQNLVDGKGEETLISEYSPIINDFVPNTFEPPQNQLICLESMEGETYQNLIKGKGEYKLTDSYSATCTESNISIDNPPSMIEIPEIWGNTVQGYARAVSNKDLVNHMNNLGYSNVKFKLIDDDTMIETNWGYWNPENYMDKIASDNSKALQLKPNTSYSFRTSIPFFERSAIVSTTNILLSLKNTLSGTFTTDDTGLVAIVLMTNPHNTPFNFILVEGDVVPNIPFDLNYIQSVGDLYVNGRGEPILDEEGNEQYKLELIGSNINLINPLDLKIIGCNNDAIISNEGIDYVTGDTTDYWARSKIDISLNLKKDVKYYFYITAESDGGLNLETRIDKVMTDVGSLNKIFTYTSTSDCTLNFLLFLGQNATTFTATNIRFMATEVNVSEFVPYTSNKTTILMPQPLRKVGEYSDKLYYDYDSKKYFISSYDIRVTNDLTTEFPIYDKTFNIRGIEEYEDYLKFSLYKFPHPYTQYNWGRIQLLCNAFEPKTGYNLINNIGSKSKSMALYYNPSHGYNLGFIFCVPKNEFTTYDEAGIDEWATKNKDLKIIYIYNPTPQIIETKILEKPSLDAYSPKTYVTTSAEVQPSQMTVTNKEVKFIPLSLQSSKAYTVQLDSIGKDNKPITVNLGGATTTIQPTNDTKKHHRVSITTPSSLTTDNLDLSGEGVVVNDVMLFEGNTSAIKQDVDYMDGIQSIGEPFESRNLFDYTQSEVGLLDHTNGNISEDNSWKYTTDFISVKPNTTYCISQTSGSVFNYKIVEYNSSKSYLKGTNWTNSKGTDINRAYNTFTTSANTYYLRLGWQVSIFEIQLEEDTFPTEFMAFDTVRYKLEIQTYDSTWDKL